MLQCAPTHCAVFVCRDFGPSSEADGFFQDQKRQMSPAPEADRQDGGQRTDTWARSVFICAYMLLFIDIQRDMQYDLELKWLVERQRI